MLFGSFMPGNFFLVVAGLLQIVGGVLLMRHARAFEDAATVIQNQLGPLGRKVASRRNRKSTIVTAIWIMFIGSVFVAFGLIAPSSV